MFSSVKFGHTRNNYVRRLLSFWYCLSCNLNASQMSSMEDRSSDQAGQIKSEQNLDIAIVEIIEECMVEHYNIEIEFLVDLISQVVQRTQGYRSCINLKTKYQQAQLEVTYRLLRAFFSYTVRPSVMTV